MTGLKSISGLVFVVALCSFSARPAWGQASVEGRVNDANTANPIVGAEVVAQTAGQGSVLRASTDAQGKFRFPAVEPGEYLLKAAATGYFAAEYSVRLAPRQPLTISFELASRRAGTQQVAVSARYDWLDTGGTSTQHLLTRAGLADLPLPARRDVLRLAQNVMPGAVLSHDNFVHVRGNELSLHEFINGVSFLDNPQEQFTPGLSPQVFQSVNMITGGFPAEFGNRFGGVLDITTRSGRDMAGHGSATLGIGTILHHNATAEYGGSVGRFGYYLYSGGFQTGRFLNPPTPRETHDLGHGLRSTAQIDCRGESNLWKLWVSGNGTNFQLPDTPQEAALQRDASRRLRSQTAVLSWQHVFSPRALLATSGYQRLVSDRLVPTSDPGTPFGQGSRSTLTTGAKTDFSYSRSGHTLKSGLDLTLLRLRESFAFDPREDHDHAEEPDPQGQEHGHEELDAFSFDGRDRSGLLGLYFQDRFSPFRNFTVDAGVRWDQVNLVGSYHAVSPRLGLAYYFPRAKSVLHFSYNRFFSPPPIEYVILASYLGNASPVPAERTGNVLPYRQNYFEIGWSQELHRKAQLEIAAYAHNGRNAFETSEISNTRLFLPTNFSQSRARGAEVSLTLRHLESLGLSARLQYAASRVGFYGPISGGFADESIPSGTLIEPAFDQTHSGTASLSYRNNRHDFWWGLLFRFGSGTPLEEHMTPDGEGRLTAVRLPAHLSEDISAGWTLWRREPHRLTLEFNVTNLTNSIYRLSKESEATPVQFAPRRVFAGSLDWHF